MYQRSPGKPSIRRTLRRRRRRGVAAVLAMMYLVLFATLSVSFFAMSSTSVQVSKNDAVSTNALMAAQSGMEFVRYQLNSLDMRDNYDFTASPVFLDIYGQLTTKTTGMGTMAGKTVAMSADQQTIYVPALSAAGATQWISLDGQTDASGNPSGAAFTATITHLGDKFVVKVTGRNRNAQIMRAVQLAYQKVANKSSLFNYGVASKGRVLTSGASWVKGPTGNADPLGSVLSADPNSLNPVVIGGTGISGDVSIVTNNTVTFSGAYVGGTNISSIIDPPAPNRGTGHIHYNIPAPPFPDIDTTGFMQFATNSYSSSANVLTNVVIPPNTNPNFTGNLTINGVLVVQPPNVLTFRGNTTINGVIVSPASPGAPDGTYPAFNASGNVLDFRGNVSATAVDAKDANGNYVMSNAVARLANGTDLRTMTGAFILAPNFKTSFSGSFGTINGSIISGMVSFSGNAGGVVQGSVIGNEVQPLTIGGSSQIIIQGRGTTNVPTGVSFGDHLGPLPGTYDEVMP